MTILIDFGKEAVRIMSQAKDANHARALIEHLKKIYFIGHEDKEKEEISRQVETLVDMAQKTFRVTRTPGGPSLEIS